MKKEYQITDEKLTEAIDFIEDKGGTVDGDSFEIMGVKGTFKKLDNSVVVEVTDKPWLVSWNFIEEKMDEFFV